MALPVTNGLVAHYDADGANFNGTTPSDGAAVDQWDDLSGNALHATQTTASAQPTYQTNVTPSGKPVVRFDGDDLLGAPAFSTALAQPNTVFVVARTSNVNSTAQAFIHAVASGGETHSVYVDNTDAYAIFAGGSEVIGGTAADTAFHVFSALFDGASSVLWLDGAQDASGDPGAEAYGEVWIGARSDAAAALIGDVAEVVVYDRALTDTERQDVENHLTSKWISTSTLVTGSGTLTALSGGGGTAKRIVGGSGTLAATSGGGATARRVASGTGTLPAVSDGVMAGTIVGVSVSGATLALSWGMGSWGVGSWGQGGSRFQTGEVVESVGTLFAMSGGDAMAGVLRSGTGQLVSASGVTEAFADGTFFDDGTAFEDNQITYESRVLRFGVGTLAAISDGNATIGRLAGGTGALVAETGGTVTARRLVADTGTLAAISAGQFTGTTAAGIVAGTGTLIASSGGQTTATRLVKSNGVLTSSSGGQATARRLATGQGTASASSAGDATAITTREGRGTLTVVSTANASSRRFVSGSGVLSSQTTLTGSGNVTRGGVGGTLQAVSDGTVTATDVIRGQGTLAATSSGDALSGVTRSGVGLLASTSSGQVAGTRRVLTTGTLESVSSGDASGRLVGSRAGTLVSTSSGSTTVVRLRHGNGIAASLSDGIVTGYRRAGGGGAVAAITGGDATARRTAHGQGVLAAVSGGQIGTVAITAVDLEAMWRDQIDLEACWDPDKELTAKAAA